MSYLMDTRSCLLSDAFVITLKPFAISIFAIPSPISPIDKMPSVADPSEPIFATVRDINMSVLCDILNELFNNAVVTLDVDQGLRDLRLSK